MLHIIYIQIYVIECFKAEAVLQKLGSIKFQKNKSGSNAIKLMRKINAKYDYGNFENHIF